MRKLPEYILKMLAQQFGAQKTEDDLERYWSSLEGWYRSKPEVQQAYYKRLMELRNANDHPAR